MSAKNTLHLTIYDPFILRPSDKRDRLLQWSFRRPPIFFQNAWFSRYVDWSLFAHGLSLLCNLSVPIGNWRLYSTWNDWRWICHININHGRKSCFFCCSANLYILIEVYCTPGVTEVSPSRTGNEYKMRQKVTLKYQPELKSFKKTYICFNLL